MKIFTQNVLQKKCYLLLLTTKENSFGPSRLRIQGGSTSVTHERKNKRKLLCLILDNLQTNMDFLYLTDPVYPGLFYNHLCHLLVSWFIQSAMICENVFVKPSYLKRYLSCVKCHMSCVTCYMSHVICHMSHVRFPFLYEVVKLVSGGSVINEAYPV